ncbi:MAG: hypothetical protein V4577_22555 [Bacteroidota bacterium]
MKVFALALLMFLLLAKHTTAQNPLLRLKYDKVMIYGFQGGIGSDMSIVDERGHLAKSVWGQAILNKEDVLVLTKKLGEKGSYGDEMAACFEPRMGLVYYLDNKIVAHLTICLGCNIVTSSIPLDPKQNEKFSQNNNYFVGAPTTTFNKYLKRLLKKYRI